MISAGCRDVILQPVDVVLVGLHPEIQVDVRVSLVADLARHAVADDHINTGLGTACDVVDPRPSVAGVAEGSHGPDLVGTRGQFEGVAFQLQDQAVGIALNGVERPGRPGSSHTYPSTGARWFAVGEDSDL